MITTKEIAICKRCGVGSLYRDYDESYCLTCGAQHDSNGNFLERIARPGEKHDEARGIVGRKVKQKEVVI